MALCGVSIGSPLVNLQMEGDWLSVDKHGLRLRQHNTVWTSNINNLDKKIAFVQLDYIYRTLETESASAGAVQSLNQCGQHYGDIFKLHITTPLIS